MSVWTSGMLPGLISGGIVLVANCMALAVAYGYHKREHKVITEDRGRLNILIEDHGKRKENCPMNADLTEIYHKLNKIADDVSYMRGQRDNK